MRRSGDETYEFEAQVEAETAKAFLVVPTIGEQFWLPKSQVVEKFPPDPEGRCTFVVKEWIARKNGLV